MPGTYDVYHSTPKHPQYSQGKLGATSMHPSAFSIISLADTSSRQWLTCRCTSVDLGKNGIGQEGTAALVQALQSNSTLQSLLLDTNSIADAGATLLAQYLSSEQPAGQPSLPCLLSLIEADACVSSQSSVLS